MPQDPKSLYLIDGHAYIHRAYHALPPLANSRGEPVQAIYGFVRALLKILRENKPDFIAVCFDSSAPTFRHKAFIDYKAHRKPADEDLKFQLPLAKDLVEAWGLPSLVMPGFEADDLIATLVRKGEEKGLRVVIVTGDKDALQLVANNVTVLNEHKGIVFTEEEVVKKYGLRPDQLVDYFALTGDASDNVPGVPGVGEKTAVQILGKYGSLDKALAEAKDINGVLGEKLRKHRDLAIMSRELVTLDRHVPVVLEPEDCVPKTADRTRLLEMLKRFEFSSLVPEIVPAEPLQRKTGSVRIVLTEGDLAELRQELEGAKELAVDVETTGLQPLRCDLVGISIASRPGAAWYIPVGHSYLGCPEQLPVGKVRDVLSRFLGDEKLSKVGQNLKYDSQVLHRYGMPMKGIRFDTLIASYCLNPSRLTHNLKDLARDLLGESMTFIEELIGKKGPKQATMDKIDVAAVAPYAGADAEVTLRLKEVMGPQLRDKDMEQLFHDVEMPLVPILAEMEEAGIRVHMDYLRELSRRFEEDISSIEKGIHQMAGRPLNLNSPKQLSALLFDDLKLPVIRRTKTGLSTDEEVLQKLSALHPLPAKIVEYRELTKLKSTYIDALINQIHPKTGRVHTSFNQAVTSTGRLSSSEPNLQNIPIRSEAGRLIRKAFVPEEGHVLLSADYSQIDLRVLAHMSDDPALCEAFRQGGDIHAATAREIFGLKKEEPVT
ncbi:MAG: DNA polymerase I, partial [Elusimicrobia bacterium]|nr:DNA polymerase I [Elusimicrobiota bacterium]